MYLIPRNREDEITGEREPQRPYIRRGEFQAWYARSRGQKGTYGSTKLAT